MSLLGPNMTIIARIKTTVDWENVLKNGSVAPHFIQNSDCWRPKGLREIHGLSIKELEDAKDRNP